jgi:hypothetical protein
LEEWTIKWIEGKAVEGNYHLLSRIESYFPKVELEE